MGRFLLHSADTSAFFDERYLWSGQGYLLHSQRHQNTQLGGQPNNTLQLRSHAYDRAGQLIASVQAAGTLEATEQASKSASAIPTSAKAGTKANAATQAANTANKAQGTQVWRYAYDQKQQRILAQETTAC
jgi:hypothetical protein